MMKPDEEHQSRHYLRDVLTDGTRPFVYRSTIRSLVGMPDGALGTLTFVRKPSLGAFKYRSKYWEETDPVPGYSPNMDPAYFGGYNDDAVTSAIEFAEPGADSSVNEQGETSLPLGVVPQTAYEDKSMQSLPPIRETPRRSAYLSKEQGDDSGRVPLAAHKSESNRDSAKGDMDLASHPEAESQTLSNQPRESSSPVPGDIASKDKSPPKNSVVNSKTSLAIAGESQSDRDENPTNKADDSIEIPASAKEILPMAIPGKSQSDRDENPTNKTDARIKMPASAKEILPMAIPGVTEWKRHFLDLLSPKQYDLTQRRDLQEDKNGTHPEIRKSEPEKKPSMKKKKDGSGDNMKEPEMPFPRDGTPKIRHKQGIKMVYRSVQPAAERIERLQNTLTRLESENARVTAKLDRSYKQEESSKEDTEYYEDDMANLVGTETADPISRVYWQRKYLGRFHLKRLR